MMLIKHLPFRAFIPDTGDGKSTAEIWAGKITLVITKRVDNSDDPENVPTIATFLSEFKSSNKWALDALSCGIIMGDDQFRAVDKWEETIDNRIIVMPTPVIDMENFQSDLEELLPTLFTNTHTPHHAITISLNINRI